MKNETKFATELNEEDLQFLAMSEEEFNERSNRLANKALNGIVDKETIEATNRVYRNWELLFGKEEAERLIALDKKLFN